MRARIHRSGGTGRRAAAGLAIRHRRAHGALVPWPGVGGGRARGARRRPGLGRRAREHAPAAPGVPRRVCGGRGRGAEGSRGRAHASGRAGGRIPGGVRRSGLPPPPVPPAVLRGPGGALLRDPCLERAGGDPRRAGDAASAEVVAFLSGLFPRAEQRKVVVDWARALEAEHEAFFGVYWAETRAELEEAAEAVAGAW